MRSYRIFAWGIAVGAAVLILSQCPLLAGNDEELDDMEEEIIQKDEVATGRQPVIKKDEVAADRQPVIEKIEMVPTSIVIDKGSGEVLELDKTMNRVSHE